uniref:Spy/CpxP family protein refolding chaperone n=1 Tax=Panagrellus redivivus TaxID=6233 RepID=A0A7E4ZWB3_PANRE
MTVTARVLVGIVLGFVIVAVAFGAPAPAAPMKPSPDLNARIAALKQQLDQIETALSQGQQPSIALAPQAAPSTLLQPREDRSAAWQPMRRMVAWQPMKRTPLNPQVQRDQVIRTIEAQLSEVLHAGEVLGVSAEDVLAHLRQRNGYDNTLGLGSLE